MGCRNEKELVLWSEVRPKNMARVPEHRVYENHTSSLFYVPEVVVHTLRNEITAYEQTSSRAL